MLAYPMESKSSGQTRSAYNSLEPQALTTQIYSNPIKPSGDRGLTANRLRLNMCENDNLINFCIYIAFFRSLPESIQETENR